MNETQAYIGAIVKTRFAYQTLKRTKSPSNRARS